MTKQPFLYLIVFLSGLAGLGYEMVWTRMLSVGLGHEIAAVLAVVGAFFSGMGLGAWALDRIIRCSNRPGRWYALLELGIGLWSLFLILLIPEANQLSATLIGNDPSLYRHWIVAFTLPFLLFLPATFAMGATLPAMEQLFSRLCRNTRSVGGLYAANTFGAVAGVMLTTFVVAPQFGFRSTAVFFAAINISCAFLVFLGAAAKEERYRPSVVSSPVGTSPRLLTTLFVTGLLGIGYEVLVIRVLSQILENTVFSFAALLSIYLLGTSAGAALYQEFSPRNHFNSVLSCLLQGTAFSCILGIMLLPHSETVFRFLQALGGNGVRGAFMGEFGLATVIFFLPTLAMGATFSHLAQGVRHQSGAIGRALSVNTIGAAFAPLVFGVGILPSTGPKLALLGLSLSYLFLIPTLRWPHCITAAAPLLLAAFLGFSSPNFTLVNLSSGGQIAAHRDGVMASVTVIEDQRGNYYLKVNNKFLMGSTASGFSDGRQGHIPLLLHPNPQQALYLGLGTGATFASSRVYPDLKADGVELIPEVIDVLPYFEKVTGPLGEDPRLKIQVADARRFVNTSSKKYDVIIADLFHPGRDGAGFLYTVEHFKSIRNLLTPDGIFCQWLPLYQMDLDLLRVIIRTFLHVFPDGRAFLATYSLQTPIVGLVAGSSPLFYSPDHFKHRVRSGVLLERLHVYRLNRFYNLFGTFIGGPDDLTRFSSNGALNTDDRPVVIFQAPRFAYSLEEPPHVRLFQLLGEMKPLPEHILKMEEITGTSGIADRLSSYWRARDRFLQAGLGVRQSTDIEEMLSQIQEPLLSIIRESPDFEAAYNPLLAMAQRLHDLNPRASQQLLLDLEAANPMRHDAKRVRKYLSDRPSSNRLR